MFGAFSTTRSHEWLLRFIQHRVADRRILRLIQKWLKAGVSGGRRMEGHGDRVRPQGSVISPLLANIYLHYVFDLWVDAWRRKCAQGEVVVVRYADDNVLGFQYRADADRFLEEFRERLRKFGLELHPDKTRRIEFGRFAEQRPETKRRRETRDVRLSGLHAYQREGPKWKLCAEAQNYRQADAGETAGDETTAASPQTRSGSANRRMASRGRAGLLQLPCGAGKHRQPVCISLSVRSTVAERPARPQPETEPDLGKTAEAGGPMDSSTACSPSLPPHSL